MWASVRVAGMSRLMTPGRMAWPFARRMNASRTASKASFGPRRSRISFSTSRRSSILPRLGRLELPKQRIEAIETCQQVVRRRSDPDPHIAVHAEHVPRDEERGLLLAEALHELRGVHLHGVSNVANGARLR